MIYFGDFETKLPKTAAGDIGNPVPDLNGGEFLALSSPRALGQSTSKSAKPELAESLEDPFKSPEGFTMPSRRFKKTAAHGKVRRRVPNRAEVQESARKAKEVANSFAGYVERLRGEVAKTKDCFEKVNRNQKLLANIRLRDGASSRAARLENRLRHLDALELAQGTKPLMRGNSADISRLASNNFVPSSSKQVRQSSLLQTTQGIPSKIYPSKPLNHSASEFRPLNPQPRSSVPRLRAREKSEQQASVSISRSLGLGA